MIEGWIEVELGQVCQFKGGGTPSKKIKEYWNGNIHWATIKDIKGHHLESTIDNITEKGLNNSASNLAKAGQIILATRINPGRPIITKIDTAINQDLKVINPKIKLERTYLFYALKNLEKEVLKNSSGTTVKGIRLEVLNSLSIKLPPLPEQRAIVAKIEQLFSELDHGVAQLKKAQAQLKVYKQAVLKKAFEGLPNRKLLGNIAEVRRGKSKHRPRNDKKLFGGKYPFIQTGEIRAANGGTIKGYENTYNEVGLAQSKLWPKGTLCLTIAANIGETAFLGFEACFPDSVVGIVPNDSELTSKYLNYYVQKIKVELDYKASATAQKNINVKFLDNLEVPLPDNIDQQTQIVQEIESRFSVVEQLEKELKENLQKAESLRQSILKQAFEGKLLTKTEIEACKKEKDWEPAEKLLERIEEKTRG